MKKNLVRQGFAIGIIVLFIGIGSKPALSNEISLSKLSESEEDCNCCINNGKTHLFEKLIKSIENHEELLKITNSYEPQYDRPICNYLANQMFECYELMYYMAYLASQYTPGTTMWNYYYSLGLMYGYMMFMYLYIGVFVLCWEAPYWPPYPY